MALIGDVTDQDFQERVLGSETPVLVDFWAEWCVPCHMVSPVVEEIGRDKGDDLQVAKLNIDENPEITAQVRGHEHPHPDAVQGRQESARMVGAAARTRSSRRSTRTSPPSGHGCRRGRGRCQPRGVRIDRNGDRGEAVRDVQHRLLGAGLRVDPEELEGEFGPSTQVAVRVQQAPVGSPSTASSAPTRGTSSSRPATGWATARCTCARRRSGDDVRELQRMLNALGFDAGKEDGILGPRTTADASGSSSATSATKVDGIVGLDTVHALEAPRLARRAGLAVVREEEAVRSMGHLARGCVGRARRREPRARPGDLRPGARSRSGAVPRGRSRRDPRLARCDARPPPPCERVAERVRPRRTRQRRRGSLACVSFRLTDDHLGAAGAYWGTATTHSPGGRRLAELIQAEVTRIGLPDEGLRPLGVALLRETRMPAVRVEIGAATLEDGRGLRHADVRHRVAEAVADGMARFLSGSAA